MYEIQFRKHALLPSRALTSGLGSLEQAKNARGVSGDLVVCSETQTVVVSDEWLWDFEKKETKCYAKHVINAQLRENLRHIGLSEFQKNHPEKDAEGQTCWLWTGDFSAEAWCGRVVMYDKSKPFERYACLIAGGWAWFENARPISFGHPDYGKALEQLMLMEEYGGRPPHSLVVDYERASLEWKHQLTEIMGVAIG